MPLVFIGEHQRIRSSMKMKFYSFVLLFLAQLVSVVHADTKLFTPLYPDDVDSQTRFAIDRFIEEATLFVPPKMAEKAGPISILFTPFENDKKYNRTQMELPRCDWTTPRPELMSLSNSEILDRSQKAGATNGKIIYLNILWIPEIVAGAKESRTFSCGHKNMYRWALATLLHEYSHVYDEKAGYPSKGQAYYDLTHWKEGTFWWSDDSNKNISRLRSPDPYEYFNPQEHFAVNMEFYLLDPEYRCRRPTLYNYFSNEHFGNWSAFPSSCKTNTEVLVYVLDTMIKSDINPERVYEVDYLLADETDSFASRWGHAMYRLIVCGPDEKTVGPHCRTGMNTAFHVVASYRANIQDMQLSKWKSLTGGYPSLLFMLTLTGVVQEYNKEDLRDLVSIPLKLSDFEKNNFVYKILENQWDYIGEYAFITRNCATESRDLLKSITWDNSANAIGSLTPTGFYKKLGKEGFVDQHLKDKIDFNKKNPYIFPMEMEDLKKGTYLFKAPIDRLTRSMAEIEKALAVTGYEARLLGDIKIADLDNIVEYQQKVPALKRRQIYQALQVVMPEKIWTSLSASFSIIENHILGYIKGIEKKSRYRVFYEKLENAMANGQDNTFGEFVRFNQALSNPALAAQQGSYGIPLTGELDVRMDPTKELSPEMKAIAIDILKEARMKNKALFDEKKAILENLILFRNSGNSSVNQRSPQ
jgi:hypothetical protein